MDQPKNFYKCDPMLNKECEKTSCQNECTFTTKKEYSKDGKKYIAIDCEFVECKEPTTKNDLGVDTVSRKAVHDMLENLPITVEDKWFNWLQKACMRLADLPSVTPQEPRKGHWISHGEHCRNLGVMPSGLGAYEWCSNCDCGIDVREWHRNRYNFCPNCGADMREVEKCKD